MFDMSKAFYLTDFENILAFVVVLAYGSTFNFIT